MEPEPSSGEHRLLVPEGTRPGRADRILARLHPEMSRTRWQKLFQAGRVWQEDHVLSQSQTLRAGTVVTFSLPPAEPLELRPVPMDLRILFEDADLLVLDKEPGRVVHPGAGTGEDTLVHGLLHHCRGSLSGIGGSERPGIVHRLDKETSGVLVVAKSEAAMQSLSWQFSNRVVTKHYTALVAGVPDPSSGTLDQPVARHPVHRTRMACRPEGRPARTDYRVARHWGGAVALLALQIHTGRTHQIRVHLKELGHPVLGDALYGFKPARLEAALGASIPVPRILLHASRLGFHHPLTGQAMALEAPLPADFMDLMGLLDRLHGPGESR